MRLVLLILASAVVACAASTPAAPPDAGPDAGPGGPDAGPDAGQPDAGQACTKDYDCAFGAVCNASKCAAGCSVDAPCPAGQVCGSNFYCFPQTGPGSDPEVRLGSCADGGVDGGTQLFAAPYLDDIRATAAGDRILVNQGLAMIAADPTKACGSPVVIDGSMSWPPVASPDGATLAWKHFGRILPEPTPDYILTWSGHGAPRVVAPGGKFLWADSQHLINQGTSLEVHGLADGTVVRIPATNANSVQIAAGGTKAVYFDGADLMVADLRTGATTRISPHRLVDAAWSPDATWFAIVPAESNGVGINLYAGPVGALVLVGPGGAPAFSSDGLSLAYIDGQQQVRFGPRGSPATAPVLGTTTGAIGPQPLMPAAPFVVFEQAGQQMLAPVVAGGSAFPVCASGPTVPLVLSTGGHRMGRACGGQMLTVTWDSSGSQAGTKIALGGTAINQQLAELSDHSGVLAISDSSYAYSGGGDLYLFPYADWVHPRRLGNRVTWTNPRFQPFDLGNGAVIGLQYPVSSRVSESEVHRYLVDGSSDVTLAVGAKHAAKVGNRVAITVTEGPSAGLWLMTP